VKDEEAEISTRTYNRWINSYNKNNEYVDKRTIAVHPEPHNKLTLSEKQEIINSVNRPEFSSLPPSQIVPILADRGIYIASESSFYKWLNKNTQ
jgi:putative transposase